MKITKMEVNMVHYKEINTLVNDTYFNGKDIFCIVEQEESYNGDFRLYDVTKSMSLLDMTRVIQYTENGTSYCDVDSLLDYLCYSGHIGAGIYLVDMSW